MTGILIIKRLRTQRSRLFIWWNLLLRKAFAILEGASRNTFAAAPAARNAGAYPFIWIRRRMHHPGISIRLTVKDQPGLRPGGWIRKPLAQNPGAYMIQARSYVNCLERIYTQFWTWLPNRITYPEKALWFQTWISESYYISEKVLWFRTGISELYYISGKSAVIPDLDFRIVLHIRKIRRDSGPVFPNRITYLENKLWFWTGISESYYISGKNAVIPDRYFRIVLHIRKISSDSGPVFPNRITYPERTPFCSPAIAAFYPKGLIRRHWVKSGFPHRSTMADFYPKGLLRRHLGENQASCADLQRSFFTRKAFSEGIWVKISLPAALCYGRFLPAGPSQKAFG